MPKVYNQFHICHKDGDGVFRDSNAFMERKNIFGDYFHAKYVCTKVREALKKAGIKKPEVGVFRLQAVGEAS